MIMMIYSLSQEFFSLCDDFYQYLNTQFFAGLFFIDIETFSSLLSLSSVLNFFAKFKNIKKLTIYKLIKL